MRGSAALFVGALLSLPAQASAGEEEPAVAISDPVAPKQVDFVVPTLHAVGLFTVQRTVEAILWPDPFARVSDWGNHYADAFTKPPLFDGSRPAFQWDGDGWPINVIGHGLMGSELYLRARHCEFGWGGSLLFTAAASTVWEYGFEGNGVRPSAQDLVYTPLMGMALGELRYFIWKSAKGGSRNVLRAVVDPFGELERALGTKC